MKSVVYGIAIVVLIALTGLGCAEAPPTIPAPAPDTGLPAFPGAEGFGADTPGGRGGRIIKVTNLNTDGPGSLQAACSAEGPRIVVFDVSGVIRGDVEIEQPYITIAGQTAPGAGITIEGMLRTAYSRGGPAPVHDVVVRFLRVRPRPGGGAQGDAIQFSVVDKAVLDHISCSWSEDETIDIYTLATNVTIQWCTIEESSTIGHSEGRHNYGLISGPRSRWISVHHNLFAHNARRNPAIGSGPADFRNNLVYNFRDGFSHEGNYRTPGFNIIGNYYKQGPSDPDIFPFCFEDDVPYYLRDNFIAGVGLIQDPWAEAYKLYGLQYYAGHGVRQETETPVPSVTTHSPEQVYDLVLAEAGCFPRDVVTRRTIEETRQGTGSWGRHEPGDLMEGLTPQPPPQDSDDDGMADEWENAHGLNPESDDSATVMPSGYTAVEEYLNELAQRLVEEGR
jgi:pectate lyase